MIAWPGLRRLAAIGVARIYAICFVGIKAGLSDAPSLLFASLRAQFAGIALLAVATMLHRTAQPERRQRLLLVAIALTPSRFPAHGAEGVQGHRLAFTDCSRPRSVGCALG